MRVEPDRRARGTPQLLAADRSATRLAIRARRRRAVGALLVVAGEFVDLFPAAIEELAREYFGRWPPEAKA